MKIEIEIPDPPEGYGIPYRRRIYLPFTEDTIILEGDRWVRAYDVLSLGGSTHICCHKGGER